MKNVIDLAFEIAVLGGAALFMALCAYMLWLMLQIWGVM